MVKLEVVNPQAVTQVAPVPLASVPLAPRLSGISGKRIGLYWIMKAGGDLALEHTARLLDERFPKTEFKHYTGSVCASMRHATAEDAELVAEECDAVVGTTAD